MSRNTFKVLLCANVNTVIALANSVDPVSDGISHIGCLDERKTSL